MSRRLRRAAAVLFVVAAALFIIGVATESDSHSETTETARSETTEAAHNESAETAHDESGTAATHDESVEHNDHAEEGSVLGVEVESPAAVAAATVASLAIAVGSWLLDRRWLALLAVGFGVVFAVFDFAEFAHQIDESRTRSRRLAAAIAAVHVAAAATSGLSIRPAGPP